MERKEAIEVIESGHSIISPDAAREVCEALGVPFDEKELVQAWHSDPHPLGVTMAPEYEGKPGVWTLELGRYIAKCLGIEDSVPKFHGRSFQARAYAEAVAAKLRIDKEES